MAAHLQAESKYFHARAVCFLGNLPSVSVWSSIQTRKVPSGLGLHYTPG